MQARVVQKMEAVMDVIREAHPEGVTMPALIDTIYGVRADGCPITANEQVGKLIKRMRKCGYPVQKNGKFARLSHGGSLDWGALNKNSRIDAIRAAYTPGATMQNLADAIGISKSAVCGFYFRYKEALADCPVVKPTGGPRKQERGEERRPKEPRAVWTPEQRAEIAAMLKQGMTADAIGKKFGMSRHPIIGLVHRNAELKAIGFAGGRRHKLSPAERQRRRMEASRRYKEKQRAVAKPVPNPPPRQPFKPVVVSNNIGLMVQDFIAKNGVRKFESNARADYNSLAYYLMERGYTLTQRATKYTLKGPSGRPRDVSYRQAVAFVDKFRMAEGLEPFLAA